MQINLEHNSHINQIQRYEKGVVTIQNIDYQHSIIVTANTITDWTTTTFKQLSAANFEAIIAIKPEVVLLGCGDIQQHLPAHLLASFIETGIGIEVMTTSAACRTYNVLVSEGRNVAAALLLP